MPKPPISGTQIAVLENRTIFRKNVKNPKDSQPVLKRADNNQKLGNGNYIIRKGKWAGFPLFYLTLEERKTCPTYCQFYSNCYGNNMYLAKRYKHGLELTQQIEKELNQLFSKYENIVIRLHVLGDFYSVSYVKFWNKMLKKYPGLHIFGYTARTKGEIYKEISVLNNIFSERVVIRYSTNRSYNFVAKYHSYAASEGFSGNYFQCPEQIGKVNSCIDCAACWQTTKTVKFLTH